MRVLIDLSGQKFGRLTVIERAENYRKAIQWRCICDCGIESIIASGSLRTGRTRSCGCLKSEVTIKRITTHGQTRNKARSSEFSIWASMVQRCTNQNNKDFQHYGGRGITVAKEWQDSYEQFLADMGERPSSKHSIDRICNDKGYSPDNCKWSTKTDQARNRRVSKNNKTGVSGVYWNPRFKKYVVTIVVNKKNKHIGCAESLEEAKSMRLESEIKYWGESS